MLTTARQLRLYNAANGATVPCGEIDDYGISWVMNTIDLGGDITQDVTNRPGAHGGWVSPGYLAPKVMTADITAWADTEVLRDKACSLIRQALPLDGFALMTLSETTPVQCQVRRSGKINETRLNRTAVKFSVGMVAPDPRMYSTTLQSITIVGQTALSGLEFPIVFPITFPANGIIAGGLVTNDGDFPTPPTVTVYGPRTAPGVQNTDTNQAVTFSTLDLIAGDTLTLDFGSKKGYLNGVYRPADATSVWFELNAGTTGVRLTGTGTGTGVVSFRNAYER